MGDFMVNDVISNVIYLDDRAVSLYPNCASHNE